MDESEHNLYEKKHNGKGIAKGFIIGFLSCLAVIAIATVVFWAVRGKTQRKQELCLGDEVTAKMNTIKGYIDKYFLYDVDDSKIDEAVYAGIMEGLDDKYAHYYTAEEYKKMQESTEGVYCGIGSIVTQDPDTKVITIVKPCENSPSEEAGIKAGDIITGVDGTDVSDMDIDQVVTLMRGEEGTKVKITIKRDGQKLDFEIIRRKLDAITVVDKMLENNIGYIVISEFDGVTVDQFAKAYDELKEQGMKGVIIDIRDNPGGRLDVVTKMLDKLLPEGLIVYTEDKNGHREEIRSDAASDLDIPCAVVVNGNSASASEIFSGALQDYGLAQIIGTQTYGKGIVQSMWQLQDGSAIKMTVENYFTPNGRCIQGIGITPDQAVEPDEDAYLKDGTDTQLNAAIDYITEQIGK